MLTHGQKVCEHLSRMELVGQAVPYRHACVFGQFLNDLLSVTSVLDTIIHTAEHPGGIGDGFLASCVLGVAAVFLFPATVCQ